MPAIITGALASTVLFGRKVGAEMSKVDQQYGISQSVGSAVSKAGQAVHEADTKLGVSRRLQDTADKVDEKTHFRENVSKANQSVRQNPGVQTAMGAISSFFGRSNS